MRNTELFVLYVILVHLYNSIAMLQPAYLNARGHHVDSLFGHARQGDIRD